jgi:hypothetical protein
MKTKFKQKKNGYIVFIFAILFLIIAFNVFTVSLKGAVNQITELVDETPSLSPYTAPTLAWEDNGTAISAGIGECDYTYPFAVQVKTCSDGAGGAIIAWADNRTSDGNGDYDLYAQRINPKGEKLWTINGVSICKEFGIQINPKLCSDGAGGAIIAWTDSRASSDGLYPTDIYAQRISATGNVMWQENGVPVCTEINPQNLHDIVGNGAGGAILTWTDNRDPVKSRVYAQTIDSAGNSQWDSNGTAMCLSSAQQYAPTICSDGAGGAIIAWYDQPAAFYGVTAQRVTATGDRFWGDNGVSIRSNNYYLTAFPYPYPKICTDGARGAIIAWGNDDRGGVFAQRVLSSGETFWTDNGVEICTALNSTYGSLVLDSLEIVSNGDGGAIITWVDNRTDELNVYAQHIKSTGEIKWTVNGTAICTVEGNQYMVEMCSDGAGGAVISWGDLRKEPVFLTEGDIDIYAQRISSSGVILWENNGIAVSTEIGAQKFPDICSDGNGGAFFAWEDYRDENDHDGSIYSQYLTYYPTPSEDLIWLDPYNLNIINDTEIGVYFEIDVDSPGYFQAIGSELPFNEINSTWLNMSIYYFYKFDLLNLNLNEDSSLLSTALVRFYYNTSLVKDPTNLKVLLGVFHALHISIWVSQNLTLNENDTYIEMTTDHFSYYCLGEIETPMPFLIWLQNYWWVIVILSAVAIAIPTAYVYTSKRSKARQVELEPVKEIPEKSIKLKGDLFERAMQKRERLLEMEPVEGASPEIGKKPKKAKKKLKEEEFTKTGEPLDKIPSVEQKEVSVHEDTLRCQVHKGAIEGLNYTCPKCKANYCLECAKALVKRGELCWVCNSKINIQSGEEITEIPIQEQLEVNIGNLSKEELFERGFVNAASILHVWILNSQNNSEIYSETLDTKYISVDSYKLLLPKILSETYEKDKFIEKVYHFDDKNMYCLMYFSKFLVNLIIVSRNRLDSTYYEGITDTVEKLEEEFVEIQESPLIVRNILDKNLELHLSREYSQIPSERDTIINKLFKDTEEINLVKSEMQRIPEKSFPEFLELYSELTNEMKEISKENEDLRDSNQNIEGY